LREKSLVVLEKPFEKLLVCWFKMTSKAYSTLCLTISRLLTLLVNLFSFFSNDFKDKHINLYFMQIDDKFLLHQESSRLNTTKTDQITSSWNGKSPLTHFQSCFIHNRQSFVGDNSFSLFVLNFYASFDPRSWGLQLWIF
jgi:hypothetical protein